MKKTKPYVIFILISLAVGGLSALLSMGGMSSYDSITTPPLSPPAILFPIVWTVLYVLMGISAARIFTNDTATEQEKRSALFTYWLSLFVNFFWSIIFFNMRSFIFAFIWLILLIYLVVKTVVCYARVDRVAAYLQIPYILWLLFAAYLNLAVYILN